MCGRFVSSTPPDQLAVHFEAEPPAPEQVLEPRYNVAPTDDVWAVLERDGVRRLEALHWGLVPFWSKDAKGASMINARSESLAESRAYRRPFAERRCLVPADGFYEWRTVPGQKKKKQPYFIHARDGAPLAFAGLWEVWRPPGTTDEVLVSCTIVTGPPNELVAPVHDRMPVILPRAAWARWLDRDEHDLDRLAALLVPAPADGLALHPVSTEVNNVRHDGPQLTVPVEPDGPDQLVLGS